MEFYEALHRIMTTTTLKIKRSKWGEDIYVNKKFDNKTNSYVLMINQDMTVLNTGDRMTTSMIYLPTSGDLTANDWEIVQQL